MSQPEPPPASLRHSEWQLAVLLTLVIVALQFHFFLHRGAFWRDEVDLLNISANHPLQNLRPDPFPVLMSLLVNNWTHVAGASDLALRSLGLLLGLALLPALWHAARTLRQSPPLLGLVLFGLNSTVIAYDQSLRAYGLGSVLILMYLAAMWSFLQKASLGRFLWLLLLAVLSVHALYQNAVLIAAISAGAWAVCLRRDLRATAVKILVVGLLAALSLQPYYASLMATRQFAAATAAINPRTWSDFLPLAQLMDFPFAGYRYAWGALLLVVILGGLARFRVNRKNAAVVNETDAPLFGGATILAALAGFVWFFTQVNRGIQPWHFLPLLAVLAPLLDLAFDLFPIRPVTPAATPPRRRLGHAAVFGLTLATALIGTAFAFRDLGVRVSNIDLIAARLNAEARPRDYILVSPWYCGISYNRYHHSATPWDTLPPISDHLVHRYEMVQALMGKTNALQSVEDRITATLQHGGRVWVAGQLDLPAPERERPKDLPPPPLAKTGWGDTPYNLVWSWQVGYFLTTHATNFGAVDLPTNSFFNQNENLQLVFAQGWRTNETIPLTK